jgi:hypothetical protein
MRGFGNPAQSIYFFRFRLCRRLGIDGLKNVFPLWTSRIAWHTLLAEVYLMR